MGEKGPVDSVRGSEEEAPGKEIWEMRWRSKGLLVKLRGRWLGQKECQGTGKGRSPLLHLVQSVGDGWEEGRGERRPGRPARSWGPSFTLAKELGLILQAPGSPLSKGLSSAE